VRFGGLPLRGTGTRCALYVAAAQSGRGPDPRLCRGFHRLAFPIPPPFLKEGGALLPAGAREHSREAIYAPCRKAFKGLTYQGK